LHVVGILEIVELEILEFLGDVLVSDVGTLGVLVDAELFDHFFSKDLHEDVSVVGSHTL
jgi:hypothetical protein